MTFQKFTKITKYPNGVYISLEMTKETIKKLKMYLKENLPDSKEPKYPYHCTIIYSSNPSNQNISVNPSKIYSASFKKFSLFGEDKNILVVEIKSDEIQKLNSELTEKYEFISDFDNYQPHFTIVDGIKDLDISKLPPINFDFHFTNESVEDLMEN